MRDKDTSPTFKDVLVKCCDCGNVFLFSAGEARFYASKQLTAPPKRCPECRRLRKLTICKGGPG